MYSQVAVMKSGEPREGKEREREGENGVSEVCAWRKIA